MQTSRAIIAVALAAVPLVGAQKQFRAGAYSIDVSPPKLPVLVSGMFLERTADKVTDPVHARCLVLDDGATRIAIVVVDSCMMPRDLLDEAKQLASRKTGIPTNRMVISATHTHSAPSAMGVLGTPADAEYVKFLPGRLAEGIEQAAKNLAPARIGWSAVDDYEHTHTRRWIYQPDKMLTDPFGNRTVRANMHPGYENPNAIAPSGPVDPQLSVIAIQSPGGKPLALLANYSQHYFGSTPVSADYYGIFANKIAEKIGAGKEFVGIMSQGTSGDQMWMDYGKPKSNITLEEYSEGVAQSAYTAYQKIQFRDSAPLAMAESRLTLHRRTPDAERLQWARDIAGRMNGRKPQNQQEVYALEAIYLHEQPVRELKLQAIRIGDLGIAAIPDEVYAITGLKIKAQSPLAPTFNIELANGAEGYIPPPEQHKLGGYTTWPARTAALEPQAEPKIAETVLQLLEKVAAKPRRRPDLALGEYTRAVLGTKPRAYWRMNELAGPAALDASGNGHRASYEDGVVFYLPGPESAAFSAGTINRAPHFAGGRMTAILNDVRASYAAEMWFWNGVPALSYLFSRGADVIGIADGRLSISGTSGQSHIPLKTWNHLALVRDGNAVRVYLNGKPEISTNADSPGGPEFFIGGRHDRTATFEGRIDEVAVYDRALQPNEIAAHYRASGL